MRDLVTLAAFCCAGVCIDKLPAQSLPPVGNSNPSHLRLNTSSSAFELRLGTTGKNLPGSGHHVGPVSALAVTDDGDSILSVGYEDCTIIAWDRDNGKVKWQSKKLDQRVDHLALALKGNLVCAAAYGAKVSRVSFHRLNTGEELDRIAIGNLACLAVSDDGKWVATAELGDRVRVWERTTLKERATISLVPNTVVFALRFSRDALTLSILSNLAGLTVYDLEKREARYGAPPANPRELCRSLFQLHDGKSLVWIESKRDSDSGRPCKILHFLTPPSNNANRKVIIADSPDEDVLGLSPHGKTLAVAFMLRGVEPRIRLFDVTSGKHLLDLQGHQNSITRLAFSADGKWLVSGSVDGTTNVWNYDVLMQEADWLRLAQRNERDACAATSELLKRPSKLLVLITRHIDQAVQMSDRVRPIVELLSHPKFDERERATRQLKAGLVDFEVALRLLREERWAPETLTRLDRLIPSLRPEEKDLPAHIVDPMLRMKELKRLYGDDFLYYPDSPGAIEIRALSRAFKVLGELNSKESRQLLESLAKRPDHCWLAKQANQCLNDKKK